MPFWLRLAAGFVLELAGVALVVGVPAAWVAQRMDLAPLAAARASAATGRAVRVGHLRVQLGRIVTVALEDVGIPNIPGGSAPDMLTLKRLTAEIDLQSILHGPLLLHHVAADGFVLLLERVGEVRNWRFGPPGPEADPTHRTGFPSLRDLSLTASQVTVRTRHGHDLVTTLDAVAIQDDADDQPVALTIKGAYHDVPLQLTGALQPITLLRQAETPYGTKLRVTSGSLALGFDGTMTAPLQFNGLDGRLDLEAPDPTPLLKVMGIESSLDTPLRLSGPLTHTEPNWTWRNATGTLGRDPVTKATLVLDEGQDGQPDKLAADLAFKSLDLNELLGAGPKGKREADAPLSVEGTPDPLLQVKAAAGTLAYAGLRAEDVVVEAARTEGRLAVSAFSLRTFGTALRGEGAIEAAPAGAQVNAAVSATGMDVQQLRQALGFGSVPLLGRLDGQLVVASTARTANAALRTARISAVLSMRGGSIAKEVIEMASTDVRALFRTNRGMTPVSCLLAGLDMRAGVGTVAPLRVRAGEGTIAGSATFDLYRRTFDLTIGSEARSTGLFALDIPVRAYGAFGAPTVIPAQWSAQGRAALAAADSLATLPPALRDYARRVPCPPSR